MGWVSTSRLGRFTPGTDPVPIVYEAGWTPGPIWTGAENLAPTGIRSRTVQPVASRYTVCAIPAPCRHPYVQLIKHIAVGKITELNVTDSVLIPPCSLRSAVV
jgi:hypothetical protein